MTLVFSFTQPHAIGSILHAGVAGTWMTDGLGNRLPDQPIVIRREATREEWVASILEQGGDPAGDPRMYPHYYEVTTD